MVLLLRSLVHRVRRLGLVVHQGVNREVVVFLLRVRFGRRRPGYRVSFMRRIAVSATLRYKSLRTPATSLKQSPNEFCGVSKLSCVAAEPVRETDAAVDQDHRLIRVAVGLRIGLLDVSLHGRNAVTNDARISTTTKRSASTSRCNEETMGRTVPIAESRSP